ncbi:MAG: DUF4296 domain-containing protein [Lacibacter sp.]|jgi:uncharacterized protein YcfL
MKLKFVVTVTLLLLFSCSGKNKVPADLIQPRQMQQVMMDLLIVDAVNTQRSITDTSIKLKEYNVASLKQVLQNHKVSRELFFKSYDYYLNNPSILKPIADSLVAEANRRSTQAYTDTSKNNFHGNNIQNPKQRPGN